MVGPPGAVTVPPGAVVGPPTAGWTASRVADPAAELQGVRIVVVSQADDLLVPAQPPADFAAAAATSAADAAAVPGAAGDEDGAGMPGRCSIVDTPERDGNGAGAATAICSATRSSAAMMIEGSGVSATGLIEPIRAPAEAAVEHSSRPRVDQRQGGRAGQ